MVRFKVDENLPSEVAKLLASLGHDASTVHEQKLGGSIDSVVAEVCRAEDRTLITLDLGLPISALIRRPTIQELSCCGYLAWANIAFCRQRDTSYRH